MTMPTLLNTQERVPKAENERSFNKTEAEPVETYADCSDASEEETTFTKQKRVQRTAESRAALEQPRFSQNVCELAAQLETFIEKRAKRLMSRRRRRRFSEVALMKKKIFWARKALLTYFPLAKLRKLVKEYRNTSPPKRLLLLNETLPSSFKNKIESYDDIVFNGGVGGQRPQLIWTLKKFSMQERPSFPFTLLQIGGFKLIHTESSPHHSLQCNRRNSVTINPELRKFVYEFSFFREEQLCYSLWSIKFEDVSAICVYNDMMHLKLRKEPTVVASFIEDKFAHIDITSSNENNLIHIVHFDLHAVFFQRHLWEYDPNYFQHCFVNFHTFYNESPNSEPYTHNSTNIEHSVIYEAIEVSEVDLHDGSYYFDYFDSGVEDYTNNPTSGDHEFVAHDYDGRDIALSASEKNVIPSEHHENYFA